MGGMFAGYAEMRRIMAARCRLRQRRAMLRGSRAARRQAGIIAVALEEKEREILDAIEAQLRAEESLPSSEVSCPECGRPFRLIRVGKVEIDTCLSCGSFWFDPGELRSLTGLLREVPAKDLPPHKSKYRCPRCRTEMKEHRFSRPHDLLVDLCPNGHGVYLEEGELLRVLDLAYGG